MLCVENKDKIPFWLYPDALLRGYSLIGKIIDRKGAQREEFLKKTKKGKILNCGSIRGIVDGGTIGSILYSASKAAVHNFSKTLAKEVAPDIQVNVVAPGYVATPAWDSVSEESKQDHIAITKLKRWIEPEEIADAFLFLAKNDACTGTILVVDAGLMLQNG